MKPKQPSIEQRNGSLNLMTHHVRPEGWENDPDLEMWKLSDLDYTQPPVFLRQTFVYKLPSVDDSVRVETENTLIQALAITASQSRTLSGILEEDAGAVRICKTRGSYITFIVKKVDQNVAAFSDIESTGFQSGLVTNLASAEDSVTGHTNGGSFKSRGQPVSEVQATWIPGGLLITTGYHHYAMDGSGFTAWVKQWARTALALKNGTAMPTWDPTTLSRHRLNGKVTTQKHDAQPTLQQKDTPKGSPYSGAAAVPLAIPQPMRSVILHFTRAKIAALKAATTSASTENKTKISSYDVITALLWQTHTRARLTMYDPVPGEFTILGSAINLRNRFNPPLHPDLQANACTGALAGPIPVLEAVADKSLPRLASLVRESHAAMTEEFVLQRLNMVASLPDKKQAALSVSSMPRFAVAVSDCRARSGGDLYDGADFGFGKPVAVRNAYQPGMPAAIRSLSVSDGEAREGLDAVVDVEVPVEENCLEPFVSDAELLQYANVISS